MRSSHPSVGARQVYDTISSHMVTLDKCLSLFGEVKKKLSKIDVEEPAEKPALKAVEAEVKVVKVKSTSTRS